MMCLGQPWPQPAARPEPLAGVMRDAGQSPGDDLALLGLRQPGQALAVGPAVAQDLPLSLQEGAHDVRVFVAHAGVERDAGGDLEAVQHLDRPPYAYPAAVLPPG